MGLFRKDKREPAKDDDIERHHVDSLDYFEEVEKGEALHCPECAKAQRHVRMVKSEGKGYECPECRYTTEVRRI